MRNASERLADAENAASEHQKRAHKDAYQSAIYPAGSEYALCYAESQIMSAVVAVLNESLTESIKGFYRLRTAYATLQKIADAETRYLEGKSTSAVGTPLRRSMESQRSVKSTNFSTASTVAVPPSGSTAVAPSTSTRETEEDDDDDDFDFVDADEGLASKPVATHYQGHLDSKDLPTGMSALSIKDETTDFNQEQEEELARASAFTHPIDIFIHSGTNLCFGILQLVLSLIPPAFSKLLSIIGFRGDREAGIKMLWRASATNNINGAMAGLIILGYYNGLIQFCDILTAETYPTERCRKLLNDMRSKFPKSRLWLLEESRMKAGDGYLEDAVAMTGDGHKSALKQVEALQWFEHSLNCLYLHRYEESAEGFLKVLPHIQTHTYPCSYAPIFLFPRGE